MAWRPHRVQPSGDGRQAALRHRDPRAPQSGAGPRRVEGARGRTERCERGVAMRVVTRVALRHMLRACYKDHPLGMSQAALAGTRALDLPFARRSVLSRRDWESPAGQCMLKSPKPPGTSRLNVTIVEHARHEKSLGARRRGKVRCWQAAPSGVAAPFLSTKRPQDSEGSMLRLSLVRGRAGGCPAGT